ncbi:hypothetical protein DHEL01_v203781 [Diaporthe helianthi]|uniref:Uncharacterized protein n=1 Tax=Diaporthe helianthi TaxID=158607 RepID=A0A2P5I5S2_DIAHE|nr:hypothetical protein DHEL01_v203781 [Diaporthe helianthi]
MVFGLRVSYHPAQTARHDSYQSPLVCPCAACFDSEEHRLAREACGNPAKQSTITAGSDSSVPNPPPPVRKRAETAGWQWFGFPLDRKQTAESTASTRPLRTAAPTRRKTSAAILPVTCQQSGIGREAQAVY